LVDNDSNITKLTCGRGSHNKEIIKRIMVPREVKMIIIAILTIFFKKKTMIKDVMSDSGYLVASWHIVKLRASANRYVDLYD